MVIDKPVNGNIFRIFRKYMEYFLLPEFRSGATVIMDNLSGHKGAHIRELIEQAGPYSCSSFILSGFQPDR